MLNSKEPYQNEIMSDYIMLVNKNDDVIGLEEKNRCHLPNGKLHRAFTSCLFNDEGKLLLTKRSNYKMLWPNCWDGTVASHPKDSENYINAAERRVNEEINASCKLKYLFKFEYHVLYDKIGSENEMCGVLIGNINSCTNYNQDEISEIKWVGPDELNHELQNNIENYCPWMIIALYLLFFSQRNKNINNYWDGSEFKKTLEKSIEYYFPNKEDWRLIQ